MFNGVVAERRAHGDCVGPNDPFLFSLDDDETLLVSNLVLADGTGVEIIYGQAMNARRSHTLASRGNSEGMITRICRKDTGFVSQTNDTLYLVLAVGVVRKSRREEEQDDYYVIAIEADTNSDSQLSQLLTTPELQLVLIPLDQFVISTQYNDEDDELRGSRFYSWWILRILMYFPKDDKALRVQLPHTFVPPCMLEDDEEATRLNLERVLREKRVTAQILRSKEVTQPQQEVLSSTQGKAEEAVLPPKEEKTPTQKRRVHSEEDTPTTVKKAKNNKSPTTSARSTSEQLKAILHIIESNKNRVVAICSKCLNNRTCKKFNASYVVCLRNGTAFTCCQTHFPKKIQGIEHLLYDSHFFFCIRCALFHRFG